MKKLKITLNFLFIFLLPFFATCYAFNMGACNTLGSSLGFDPAVGFICTNPNFSNVAFSGLYSDLLSKPTNVSAFTNDVGYLVASSLMPYATTSSVTSSLATKQNTITTGTSSQYFKGDLTLGTFPTSLAPTGAAGGVLNGTYPNPSSLTATTVTPGSYTNTNVTFGTDGRATAASSGVRTFNYPSRALNSCFQISSTQDAEFHYKVDVSTGLTLTAGAQGTVTVTSYTNSGCTTGSQVIADGTSSQTGTLAAGLNINQTVDVSLDGTLPKNTWVKIVTANTVGTPTFAIRSAQSEILLP